MDPEKRILIGALSKCLTSLEEITLRLHFVTVEMPRDEARSKVRDEVSCLASVEDVMRQALDAIEGNWLPGLP